MGAPVEIHKQLSAGKAPVTHPSVQARRGINCAFPTGRKRGVRKVVIVARARQHLGTDSLGVFLYEAAVTMHVGQRDQETRLAGGLFGSLSRKWSGMCYDDNAQQKLGGHFCGSLNVVTEGD